MTQGFAPWKTSAADLAVTERLYPFGVVLILLKSTLLFVSKRNSALVMLLNYKKEDLFA